MKKLKNKYVFLILIITLISIILIIQLNNVQATGDLYDREICPNPSCILNTDVRWYQSINEKSSSGVILGNSETKSLLKVQMMASGANQFGDYYNEFYCEGCGAN